MRHTLSAIVIAAGLLGLGATAQAAAVPTAAGAAQGIAGESFATPVQMTRRERRMVRHHRMHRRMMHRRMMHRRMMRRM